jgi:hypothetical protein
MVPSGASPSPARRSVTTSEGAARAGATGPEEDAMIPEAQKQAGRLAGLVAVLQFAVAAGLGGTS